MLVETKKDLGDFISEIKEGDILEVILDGKFMPELLEGFPLIGAEFKLVKIGNLTDNILGHTSLLGYFIAKRNDEKLHLSLAVLKDSYDLTDDQIREIRICNKNKTYMVY